MVAIPAEMWAVGHTAPASANELRIERVPTPVPTADEVLVRVLASALNRADLLQRRGLYPPPPGASPILGLEVVGEVVIARGTWQVGDRVMAVITGGAYAEYACIPVAEAMAVPATLTDTEAAALPEAFLTAWLNLMMLGQLTAGQHIFVHAGTSGVGSAAIQLARQIGAVVHTSASTPLKQQRCREWGAQYVYASRSEPLAPQVLQQVGDGVDVVLDMIGAPAWADNCAMLRRGGRLLLLGFLGGSAGSLDLGPILTRNLLVTGTTLRRTAADVRAQLAQDVSAWLAPCIAQGQVVAVVDGVYGIHDVGVAHQHMESNANIGKIVLRMDW